MDWNKEKSSGKTFSGGFFLLKYDGLYQYQTCDQVYSEY